MKDAFYFPHDVNAQNDPKCIALIEEYGMEGYGLYWVIIEMLHQEGGTLEKVPGWFKGVARRCNMSEEMVVLEVDKMVNDYKLLQQNESFISCERVVRNVEDRRQKRDVKSEAGRAGGLKSGSTRQIKQIEAVLDGETSTA